MERAAISDAERPLASWTGEEQHDGKIQSCLTVIFRTSGCTYAQCLMCSYKHERYSEHFSEADLLTHLRSQLAWLRQNYKIDNYTIIKIFTSGSFFDPHEVPPQFVREVIEVFSGKVIIAETRPEFVIEEVLLPLLDSLGDGRLYCAIGLETSNDQIREKSIKKGFLFSDFVEASSIAQRVGVGVKAYLLFKPLFLTESEAIQDMHQSIRDTIPYAELISLNPCTVQSRTELEFFWRRGEYRPPYLWSLLEILSESPIHLTCDPLGGGKRRGPHNCGSCDDSLVSGIRDYSLSGDKDLITALREIPCRCKEEWMYVLENEMSYALPLTE